MVTLNRPEKLNALNAEMMARLADAWDDLAQDEAVRVILLTGAGERAFCVGADLGSLAPLSTGARQATNDFEQRWVDDQQSLVDRALLRNIRFLKPVVAAINGMTVGGGFELMLGSDIRIAADTSSFMLREVRHGLIPSGGALARLPRQVSWPHAMEMILAAASIDAARAQGFGLVNRIVPPHEVVSTAWEICREVALGAPLALLKAKEAAVRSMGLDLEQAFLVEQECQAVIMASEDAREGPLAFMERRSPQFVGR